MTAFYPTDVDKALYEAAWRDVATIVGKDVARALALYDVGAVTTVHALLAMGWWPSSPSRSERDARIEYAQSLRDVATTPWSTRLPT